MSSNAQDRLSAVEPFSIGGVRFRCWITDAGQRYEWRSDDDSRVVGRNVGNSTCWARIAGVGIGSNFPSLRLAMSACVRERLAA